MGPTLGGLGVEQIGFAWTTTIIAFINLIFVVILLIFFAYRAWNDRDDEDRSSCSSNEKSTDPAV